MFPGVLQLEALAQAGGIAVLADPRYAGKLPLFGGVEECRFRRIVRPGDTIVLAVEMERLSARGGWGRAVATCRRRRLLPRPAALRVRPGVGASELAPALLLLAQPAQLREVRRAVRLRVVVGRRGREGGIVGILSEQHLGLGVAGSGFSARTRREGANTMMSSRGDRGADDQPDSELHHVCTIPGGIMQHRAYNAPEWWNGRHGGLKIRCSQGHVGSNPTSGTEIADE